ncbi:uncharacterized protein BO87DRAFT_374453 [Aspergillus neoniger CBS 115656]|uniref:Uncharacterized protein n=1 Tax=Aspergillus neoniger (strain CBS 115656) TaxID=1448310 RepID=A0A318YQ43_ASPNB|nr:hypothetical protein BO87DRAFT_374453 [Aspergillus neoniger CBS 115656]PYH36761.1 hypothetical protein BO87DRAFT_374453 [Aspergillus neoniger CBS 115656]
MSSTVACGLLNTTTYSMSAWDPDNVKMGSLVIVATGRNRCSAVERKPSCLRLAELGDPVDRPRFLRTTTH